MSKSSFEINIINFTNTFVFDFFKTLLMTMFLSDIRKFFTFIIHLGKLIKDEWWARFSFTEKNIVTAWNVASILWKNIIKVESFFYCIDINFGYNMFFFDEKSFWSWSRWTSLIFTYVRLKWKQTKKIWKNNFLNEIKKCVWYFMTSLF